jgi:hypothetical protein
MLQSIKAKIGELRRLGMAMNSHHATFIVKFVRLVDGSHV